MPKKYLKEQISSFRQRVYRVVRSIPKGKVLTYRQVAGLAGSPRAFRAVGTALNRNPDPGNIPCHRVIRTDGKLGGYRWGKNKKASLLKEEGVTVND